MSYVQCVLESVIRKNAGEPEFHQAVREVLDCLAEHDEGVRLLADYFTDHYDSLLALAYHGVFEVEVDLERAFTPKSARVSITGCENDLKSKSAPLSSLDMMV